MTKQNRWKVLDSENKRNTNIQIQMHHDASADTGNKCPSVKISNSCKCSIDIFSQGHIFLMPERHTLAHQFCH